MKPPVTVKVIKKKKQKKSPVFTTVIPAQPRSLLKPRYRLAVGVEGPFLLQITKYCHANFITEIQVDKELNI